MGLRGDVSFRFCVVVDEEEDTVNTGLPCSVRERVQEPRGQPSRTATPAFSSNFLQGATTFLLPGELL